MLCFSLNPICVNVMTNLTSVKSASTDPSIAGNPLGSLSFLSLEVALSSR